MAARLKAEVSPWDEVLWKGRKVADWDAVTRLTLERYLANEPRTSWEIICHAGARAQLADLKAKRDDPARLLRDLMDDC